MPITFESEQEEYWKKYPYDIGKLRFPRDEGIHDYLTEWWYINLHLTNIPTGKNFDVMVTYFPKNRNMPFSTRLLLITDEKRKLYLPSRKIHFGKLNASEDKQKIIFKRLLRKDVWIQIPRHPFQYMLKVNNGPTGLKIAMCSEKPPLPVGGNGYISYGNAGHSYYYSLTRLNVAGILKINGYNIPVVGKGWMDHQFGNFSKTDEMEGYEWFCIQLENNVDIICWYIYENGVVVTPMLTYMFADNSVEVTENFKIEILDHWTAPKLERYSSKWRITEPKRKLNVTVVPVIPNQLLYLPFPYVPEDQRPLEIRLKGLYEGSTTVEGKFNGKTVKGVGYAELTTLSH